MNFTDVILDLLKQEAVELGSDLIEDGVDLVKKQLRGEATEEEMWAWIREAQGRTQ